jgi:hypothetical protein
MKLPLARCLHVLVIVLVLVKTVAGCSQSTSRNRDGDVADGDGDADLDGDIDGDGDSDGDLEADGEADSDGDADGESSRFCPALPPPPADAVRVDDGEALVAAVEAATPGVTILLAEGTYVYDLTLMVMARGVTIRGEPGERERVVLEPGYIGVEVHASDVTVADLTIRGPAWHGIQIFGTTRGGLSGFRAYNVSLMDSGRQPLEVVDGGAESPVQDSEVACSAIGYSSHAPDASAMGVYLPNVSGWIIRDNLFTRMRGLSSLNSVPALFVGSGSADTVIERNLFIDCFRSILIGDFYGSLPRHFGGVVRNNFIVSSLPSDTGIEVIQAVDFVVANNTVMLLDPIASGVSIFTWGEADENLSGEVAFNLTNLPIAVDDVRSRGNLTDADPSWFVDPEGGDLHLTDEATSAFDRAVRIHEVMEDFDGDPRGEMTDVGADQR